MNLFVTGGTGFLGSHFLIQALGDGHAVTALRRPGACPRIVLPAEPTWLEHPQHSVPMEAFVGVDALLHFAAAGVSPQQASWQELFQVNVADSLALWIRAADAGVRRFIVCGSCFEYGASGERYDFIPVDAPLDPTNGYGASKAAATMAAVAFARERKLEMLVLRPFHFFGEGQHGANLWPSLRRAALAGEDFPMTPGEQIRDFSPVELVADCFLQATTRELTAGDPVVENVGTGEPQTLREFAERWWREWQAPGRLLVGAIPYRPGEVMRYVPQLPKSH